MNNNELVTQQSWWKRNWKWVVPVGGCLSLMVIGIVIIGSVVYGVSKTFEDSQPYTHSLMLANENTELLAILGSPIEEDGMVQGKVNWNNGKKSADLRIPISGPKGNGILYVNASGEGDNWNYQTIEVITSNEQKIDLLNALETN